MSMTTSVTSTHLTRANLWSNMLKDIFLDELSATKYVRWLTDFPDGTTFNIPSVGQASVQDVQENVPVTYEALDTGNFTFTISEYVGSAQYITRKAQQDAWYSNELEASFVPKERRAIEEKLETDIFAAANSGQTASDDNAINGRNHRLIGSGTSQIIALGDFAKAKLALKKANVPMTNLVAIVDPSVGYTLETLSNLVSVSNNPQWEGIVSTGITTGMRFVRNVYGFDVWESNYLPSVGTSVNFDGSNPMTTANNAVNMFFSAAGDAVPLVGAWRQLPVVDSEFNKDLQRDEYLTTARYGVKLYRPENLVTICTDTAV